MGVAATIELLYEIFNKENDTNIIKKREESCL